MTRRQALLAGGAVAGALVIAIATATPALTATEGAPSTVVRKSVQTLMDPSGDVQARRVYTQIQSSGDGQVTFTDAANGSLRNLNGFGLPPIADGKAMFDFTVNGLDNQRTLQDYTNDLPISVKVTATLDGQEISPNDVVGKTGLLKMTYVIKNETTIPAPITWTDGTGQQQTKVVPVPMPYVGSFTTDLPDSYAQINAPGASMGGTGRNSTQLSYNLIMYKPLGDIVQTISYEARVTNADIPQVDLTFLPAGPADNASTAALQDQIKGGQEAGAQLTDAGTQIDDNLLKLAAGAGTLNAGLAQLYAGAQTLSSGLNDTAVPGAKKLAAGATLVSGGARAAAKGGAELANGAVQLSDGAASAQAGSQKLAAGSAQVAAGANDAATGGKQLATGSASLAAGTSALASGIDLLATGISQLPTSVASDPGFVQLKGALAAVQAGIGHPNDTSQTTLLGGLNAIRAGLDNPSVNFPVSSGPCNPAAAVGTTNWCGLKDALQSLSFGLSNPGCSLSDPLNPLNPCGALQGVDGVMNALASASASGGPLDQLIAAAKGAYAALVSLAGCPTTLPGDPGIIPGVPAPSVMLLNGISNTSPCYAQSSVVYGLALPAATLSPTDPGGVKAQSAAGAAALGHVSSGLSGQALPGIAKMVAGIGTDATAGTLLNGTVLIKGGLYNAPLASFPYCDPAAAPGSSTACGIYQVMGLVSGGLDQLVQGIADQLAAGVGTTPPAANCDPTKTLTCGAAAVDAGASQVAAGNSQLSAGLTTLAGGAGQVATGNRDLASGLTTLAGGAGQVAAGSDQLATGLATLSGGASQVSDGAGQLATGLEPAASGATQISDGLGQAVPGGKQIEDGASQLSEQGTKKLIATGNDTANSYGEQYGLMQALNVRSATQNGIPNGPAEATNGSQVATSGVFAYELAGVSQSDTTNAMRFLLAAVLLAAAVGVGLAFARN